MWFESYYKNRKRWIWITVLVAVLSLFSLPFLKFAFNFEQFFPTGDPDLEFFQKFIEEFETDDNFLLIAIQNDPSIFDTSFLKKIKQFTSEVSQVKHIKEVQSLPDFRLPSINLMGPTFTPLLKLDNPESLKLDSIKLLNDERFIHNLINKKANSTVVILKTEDGIQIKASKEIINGVNKALENKGISDYHILGRAYFQTELSRLQFKEILISTIISSLLISIIMILIFRRWRSILIALSSIALALVIFLGLLSILGRQLSLMSALYPILMLIVGTSDVVHIMSKYFDELTKGNKKKFALETTIRQIGLATLLTSLTTAIGFASLLSSRIIPIREFGINSAMGVIVAFVVMITFTCPLMSLFDSNLLIKKTKSKYNWNSFLDWCFRKSAMNGKTIAILSFIFIIVSVIGITKIHTNYELSKNLPKNAKITEDFMFFENEYAGFRPLEIACHIQDGYKVYDYEVLQAINKTESYIRSKEEIQTSYSLSTIVKSLNQGINFNRQESYVFPDSSDYGPIRQLMKSNFLMGSESLISKDQTKTRISTKIKDVGADNIKALSRDIDQWINENVDDSIVKMMQTGTGIILDKNAEFVRHSLLYGLGFALLIVCLLMGLLFKSIKYLFIAVIPNLVPLLLAAALLGYGNIPLEAGTAIVFAIIFGIAVDDTIHFLSKYNLSYAKHKDVEKALYITFTETGKAIIYTSIILFFGFLVLLFSSNQPSVIIGLLISITLVSAVLADLFLLPLIIRQLDKPKN